MTTKKRSPREVRQRRIIDHVLTAGFASTAELTELTGASTMTTHRDIDELAHRGILRKFHGGVSARPSTVFESSSDFRLHSQPEAKESLADVALGMVEPGMSVLLDDSTTGLALARRLHEVGPLTVVTNYRLAIEVLREDEDIRLISLGGEYSRTHDSFIGLPSQASLSALSVDIAFQSTSAMTAHMAFHQEQEIIMMKRAMLETAATKVLMMDSSKVGRTALHRFVPTSAFDTIIVTDDAPANLLDVLREETTVALAPAAQSDPEP
ncbi:DeoR/GlpR family DNA-binding transcription regulator [Spelaeicoccus albus]|uniref:DeoR/GlpR family transcriptional regulator of sugar metabolism n=1 Tax=Spelaeicoccus albus TaxID=1280376 RepID=A0A7Z0A7W1_9MICO|nr:DeoR/GlpR family DNA-binding transcription regulator [Spelaeicoccus albus]NYI66002.1 DeoR/GlpR family transcriptional regulator of sugar metabolism [Spelaeicoccus albus]